MSKIVGRTLDFLELFAAEKRPLSLSDISRLLGIPASSCHDVLQILLSRGFIYELGPRAGFYPTMRLHRLASTIAENDPMLARAEAELGGLRDRLDESVFLSKPTGGTVVYLLVLEASHPLRFLVRVGDPIRSLHATSAGKAYLGSLAPDEFDAWVATADLAPLTERTLVDRKRLAEEIRRSREDGVFLNREESIEGAVTLSGLFRWNRSAYIVTVAGPTARVEPKIDIAADLLRAACRRIEAGGGSAV